MSAIHLTVKGQAKLLKMASGKFTARTGLEIFFKRVCFVFASECDRDFYSPGPVFGRVRAVAAIMLRQT